MDEIIQIENFIGYELPISVKSFLSAAAYTALLSLKMLSADNIIKLEKFININRDSVRPDRFTEYRGQKEFSFLPGHRDILLNLPTMIENMKLRTQTDKNEVASEIHCDYSVVFNQMVDVIKKNQGKSKNARKYNDAVKQFSTYIFLLCGRTCYETLNKSLPMPSTKTILRCINESKTRIVEGQLRCEELRDYLNERKASTDVWLSEDASGVISKIQYDPTLNQLIGIVLPFDDVTGCPKMYASTARDVEEIQKYMEYDKSSLVYIVMATSLTEGVPPFVIQMFGSDNRFKSQDVVRRWDHTTQALKKVGINVRGISADGDHRLLSSMRHQMIQNPAISYVQDTIHIGTKLRNRMLNTSVLPMGNKQVSISHMQILVNEVPKEIHGLIKSDFNPSDRQNFDSLSKCMNIRARNALSCVVDSEATAFYFKLCFEITSSFMDYNLMPLERVELIHHAVYFLRIWRKWITSSNYTLRYNFITSNANLCTEINAENLLLMIRRCRDEGKPELFLPPIFSSQHCESAFRQFRAMGTVNFTRINFTLLELFHMIKRLEVQNDLLYTKLPALNIPLPKLEAKNATMKTKIYALPSDDEIERSLERAKRSAIDDALTFGMQVDPFDIEACAIRVAKLNSDIDIESDSDDEDELLDTEGIDDDHNYFITPEVEQMLDTDGEMHDAYAKFVDHTGTEKKIRKSTVVWLMSEGKKKISNDRLTRVQQTTQSSKNNSSSNQSEPNSEPKRNVGVMKSIKIGDWCFFKYDNGTVCVGLILSFKFKNGKTEKEKRYKDCAVDFDSFHDSLNNLEVLSSWYVINDSARFIPVERENHCFLNLVDYIATVFVKPMVDEHTNTLYFDEKEFKEIDCEILKLMNK